MKEQQGYLAHGHPRDCLKTYPRRALAEPISILDGGRTPSALLIKDPHRRQGARFRLWRYQQQQDEALYPWNRSRVSMVQEYLENAGGAVSIEDNMGNGTVVTVSLDPKRVQEIERAGGRGGCRAARDGAACISPAGSFCAAAHGNATDAAPRGHDAAARNASTQESQAASMSMPPNVLEAKCRWRIRCSSNAAGDGAPRPANGYQPYQQGYPYQQMPPLGYGQQFPASSSRDISSRTSRCRSSTTPGPSR